MAKNVTISSTTTGCNTEKCITVDYPTINVKKRKKLKFTNDLDGDVSAQLEFYNYGEKQAGNPINEFCKNTPGTVLTVPANGVTVCKMWLTPGDYEYSIAANDHSTLDPIIIIDPYSLFGLLAAAVVVVVVAGVVGAKLLKSDS